MDHSGDEALIVWRQIMRKLLTATYQERVINKLPDSR